MDASLHGYYAGVGATSRNGKNLWGYAANARIDKANPDGLRANLTAGTAVPELPAAVIAPAEDAFKSVDATSMR